MEALGPLTYKSHDMVCSNEFLYPWDRFWYTSYLYFIIFYKISIFRTLGGPWDPHKENWGAPNLQIPLYDVFQLVSLLLGSFFIYSIPIIPQNGQIPDFWALQGPMGGLGGWVLKLRFSLISQTTWVSTQSIQDCQVGSTLVHSFSKYSRKCVILAPHIFKYSAPSATSSKCHAHLKGYGT